MESSGNYSVSSSPSSTITSASQIESTCNSDLYSFSNTCSILNDINTDIYQESSFVSSATCICNDFESISKDDALIKPKTDTNVNELYLQFNKYFKTKAKSIQEIISILVHQNDAKNKFDKKQKENTTVEEENNNLKLLNSQLQSKLSQLEHQLSTIINQNSTITDKNTILSQKVTSMQNAILSMENIIESNLYDIKSLGQQRETLLDVVSKQASIIHSMELESSKITAKINSNPVQFQNISKQIPEENNNYSILCSIARQAIEIFDKGDEKIEKIRDDSSIPLNERILLIVQMIIDLSEQNSRKVIMQEEKLEKSNQTILRLKNKISETLAMFEAQHRFLSNLTHSTDLQSTMFWDEQSAKVRPLTQPNREELIRRCARFGQFIEETLGEVSLEKYEEIIGSHSKLDFFELLRPQNFVDSMEALLDRLESSNQITENNDMREIFDLLCAQVLMNYILKNYAQELRNVVDVNRLRLAKIPVMEAEAAAAQDAENVGERELRRALKREKAIRDYIGQMMEFDGDIDTPKLVKKAISSMKHALRECVSRVEEYQKQILQFISEKKELMKEKESLNQQITEIQNQLENLNIEFSQKDLQISEKDDEIEKLKKEIEIKKREIQNAKEKLKKAEKKIKDLSAKVESFDEIVESIKKQRATLGAKMESIQKSSEEMKARHIEEKKNIQENYSAQIEAANNQLQQTTLALTEERQKNNELTLKIEEMTTALTKANVELKSFEMRLKNAQQQAEIDYRSQQMKAQAIAASQFMEMSSKLSEVEQKCNEAFNRISTIVGGNNLKQSLDLFEEEIQRLKQIESKYLDLLNEIGEIRNILQIDNEVSLVEAVLEQTQQKAPVQPVVNTDVEQKLKESQKEIEKIRLRLRTVDEQLSQVKQWERWAHRLHSAVSDSEASEMTPEEMRLSLGEYLLSSVSKKHSSYIINSLRIQKRIILSNKSLVLTKSTRPESLYSVIATIITIKRMQRLAGCLPCTHIKAQRQSNPRAMKKEKRSQPLIPLFV